jgi:hypothetical protein
MADTQTLILQLQADWFGLHYLDRARRIAAIRRRRVHPPDRCRSSLQRIKHAAFALDAGGACRVPVTGPVQPDQHPRTCPPR